jgi:hypothetical protein
MKIDGLTPHYPSRMSSTDRSSISTQHEAGPLGDVTPLMRAHDLLRKTNETDAAERKMRAQQKLEDAKARVAYLTQWGFPPEVVTRETEQLSAQIIAAINEFAFTPQTAVGSSPLMIDISDEETEAREPGLDRSSGKPNHGTHLSVAQRAYLDNLDE